MNDIDYQKKAADKKISDAYRDYRDTESRINTEMSTESTRILRLLQRRNRNRKTYYIPKVRDFQIDFSKMTDENFEGFVKKHP
jgi:hypothetical protein